MMSEELKEKLKEMLVIDFFRGVAKGDEKLVDGFTRDENLLPVLTPNGKAFIDQLLELFEEYVKEIIGEDDSTAVSSLGAERVGVRIPKEGGGTNARLCKQSSRGDETNKQELR